MCGLLHNHHDKALLVLEDLVLFDEGLDSIGFLFAPLLLVWAGFRYFLPLLVLIEAVGCAFLG